MLVQKLVAMGHPLINSDEVNPLSRIDLPFDNLRHFEIVKTARSELSNNLETGKNFQKISRSFELFVAKTVLLEFTFLQTMFD